MSGLPALVRRAPPYFCAAANLLASLAMVTVLRPGTELVADASQRVAYIQAHRVWWVAGWGAWMAAALSLLVFYGWWASKLRGIAPRLGVGIAAVGVACDLFAEFRLAWLLPEHYDAVMAFAILMTAGVANGLYTIGGVILTLATPALGGFLRVWTWLVWASGITLSVTALTGNAIAIAVASAVLFGLFCPWVVVMGWKLNTDAANGR